MVAIGVRGVEKFKGEILFSEQAQFSQIS